MVHSWILSMSLLCAAPDRGNAMQGVETQALLNDCRECLVKKGREWDQSSWSYVFEWDGCLEEKLFKKISLDQKMVIKRYMSGLGYYWSISKGQNYSGAKNRIRPKDVDGIVAVVERTIQPKGNADGYAVPTRRSDPPRTEVNIVNKDLPGAPVAPVPPIAVSRPRLQVAEDKAIDKGLSEARVSAAPASRPSVQGADGKTINLELREDRVVLGAGVVFLPKGVLLLVRKGNDFGAISITDIKPAEKIRAGSATYESYFQGDGSGAFRSMGVVKRGGRVVMKPLEGADRLDSNRGASRLRVGDWSFGYGAPGCLGMFPYAATPGDYGYEFAPVAIREIGEVDVHDKRIQWYRYDPNNRMEILLKELPR